MRIGHLGLHHSLSLYSRCLRPAVSSEVNRHVQAQQHYTAKRGFGMRSIDTLGFGDSLLVSVAWPLQGPPRCTLSTAGQWQARCLCHTPPGCWPTRPLLARRLAARSTPNPEESAGGRSCAVRPKVRTGVMINRLHPAISASLDQ